MVSRVQISEGLLYTWHKTLAPTLDDFFRLEFGQKWTSRLIMTTDTFDWFMRVLLEFSSFSIRKFHFQLFNAIGQDTTLNFHVLPYIQTIKNDDIMKILPSKMCLVKRERWLADRAFFSQSTLTAPFQHSGHFRSILRRGSE